MTSDFYPTPEKLRQAALATVVLRLIPGCTPPGQPVPLRCGAPAERGRLAGGETAWLIGPAGEVLAGQAEVTARWPDGSARWMLIDTVLPAAGDRETPWSVVFVAAQQCHPILPALECRTTGGHIVCGTGVVEFVWEAASGQGRLLPAGGGDPIVSWKLPAITDAAGATHFPLLQECRWETTGPVRATLWISAAYPQVQGMRLMMRQSVFAGTGLLQTEIAWHNPHRARHRGGLWDLGDTGSIIFREALWQVIRERTSKVRVNYQLEPHTGWLDSRSMFSIHQESSGGEHWDSVNHVDHTGIISVQYRGFTAQIAKGKQTGLRATPTVRLTAAEGIITGTVPHFWQQFPKSLAANADGFAIGLFPNCGQHHCHELQGGERKTHTVWLKFDPPEASLDTADLSWVHDPPRFTPALTESSIVPGWPELTRLDATPMARLDELCDAALHGPASVFVRREEIDEYGWRNFGEFFADHETVYYRGQPSLISHYNNQYDVLGGLLLQGLRSGDRQWYELADGLIRHVTDIDLYHTREDRTVYNGGLFWLTDHYTTCGTATHRTFSQRNFTPGKPYGGGPAGEHNYTTGLLAYYWLAGDPAARDAVTQLADWVIAMEDGRKTILGLIDDGPTGAASATAQPDYHGPGRGAGNSINALLDGWLLTGQRPYLQFAEQLIRRCIHPADDIAARDLLNFELRWSYTVFLMAAFKYLQCKEELGEFDETFEYARQSLLHYARWMLDHERPYFDRVEQMEFPTETWGAQEFRKANVLRWAAVYADEPLRGQLQRKGVEFAERAWHDLCRFPTRTFIRPLTLAMIQGLWDAALRAGIRPCEERGPTPASWGEPMNFVNQRSRVKQMLKSPRGLCTALLRALQPRRWRPFLDAVRRLR